MRGGGRHLAQDAGALAMDGDSDSALEDVHGDLLAYVVDTHVHVLDLSNGREVVVNTPGATGPAHAAFGSGGLFYSYNLARGAPLGRILFVPLNKLL